MNQHSIQEAYLKNFCVNGKLWIHDIKTKLVKNKPASQCTTEKDFQPIFLEQLQNNAIESPGIKSLRKLLSTKSINQTDFQSIVYWLSLHIIRNQNFRNQSNINYKNEYSTLLEIENKFSNYFKYLFVYSCDNDKYFITSDSPIIEFIIENEVVRIFPLSPKKILVLTPIDNIFSHKKLEFTEMINSMIWASSYKKVFCNKKELPYAIYERNIKKWNFEKHFEKVEFTVNNY